jgi:hypothetical protein
MKKNIEEMLDDCIAEMRAGASLESVLAAYPESSMELLPLLKVTLDLSHLPEPELSIRGLMHALSRQSTPRRQEPAMVRPVKFPFFSFPMLMRVAASVFAAFVIGWGVSIASAQAVPGDWMYPVKRMAERMKLMLTVNAAHEAELRISFSEQRMSEAVRKYERGEGLDDTLLRSMLEDSKLAIEEALTLNPQERSYMLSRVGYLSAHQRNMIETVKRTADPVSRPVADEIGNVCTERMKWMEGMMKDMNMTPPSYSGCWWTPSREVSTGAQDSATRGQDSPTGEQMQQWMDDCPDWNN